MAATKDPDVHLIVDGVPIRARSATGRVYTFDLPAGAQAATLASRSVVPALVGGTDPRRLGVPVHRIVFKRTGAAPIEIGPDHPRLMSGFHQHEGTHRWTDGRAVLPPDLLVGLSPGTTVEVHIGTIDLEYPS